MHRFFPLKVTEQNQLDNQLCQSRKAPAEIRENESTETLTAESTQQEPEGSETSSKKELLQTQGKLNEYQFGEREFCIVSVKKETL